MNGDNMPNMKLHDLNHAVDDYLDRLLDDGTMPSEQTPPLEETGVEVVEMLDSNEPSDSQRPGVADQPSACTMDNEMSPDRDETSQVHQAGDELPGLVGEKAEASDKGLVDEQSDEVDDSEEISEQSMSLLKFRAMGLNFAIPLEKSAGDYPCPEDIAFDQDGPEWLLGEILLEGAHIRIVNIVAMIIPDSKRESLFSDSRPRCSRVLRVAKADWGFLCDGNVERIDLPLEEINWRTEQGKRQWLAGTIVDLKCALLDVSVIEQSMNH